MKIAGKHYTTVWRKGGSVFMLDQNQLPHAVVTVELSDSRKTADAIKIMTVRGAPAIGAAAGYAMAQSFLQSKNPVSARQAIEATRPTAVDLFAATKRVFEAATNSTNPAKAAFEEADALSSESVAACMKIGELGFAEVFEKGGAKTVLTHCNAGWLACVDWGTALAPVYWAKQQGATPFVYNTETRPRGQGARLTAFELSNEGIEHRLIADGAAASLMAAGKVDAVIVGADRIVANGDFANKIGTYSHALAAREHGVPFYVAAPVSTIDLLTKTGGAIPIEYRGDDEIHFVKGVDEDGVIRRVRWTDPQTTGLNPGFDATPAKFVTRFITEKGVFKPGAVAKAANKAGE